MNYINAFGFGSFDGFSLLGPFLMVVLFWTLYWKGRALWIAARKGSLYWFMALLIINTAGILEISYIYFFSKKEFCCGGGKDEKSEEVKDSCDCSPEHK